MKHVISRIFTKVGIKSTRTKNITKHVFLSFIYKGGSILASFLLVPITINYLDTENYGIWLTLSSFIGWFSFFDIGFGNGLRNKFAEARAKDDMTIARAYVSSTYYTIGSISLILMVLFVILNSFINWSNIFNTKPDLQKDLLILMPIVFGFFCLQMVVKLITTIYTADQHYSMQGKINFFIQGCSLLLIWIMTLTSKSSLLLFGIIISVLPVFILLYLNIFAFAKTYKIFKPTFSLWRKVYIKDIFGLGINFFIIQISGIILFATDNLIISNLFSPAEVVPYNIAFKYFSIIAMLFSIIANPYWTGFTEAYQKRDFAWIKQSIKSLEKFVLILTGLLIILVVVSEQFYNLWIGHNIPIPFILTLLMAFFSLCSIFVTPFTMFLNGTGKIKLQALQGMSAAILNIPLSILFAKIFHLGISGVIFATIVCFIPSVLLAPIQYRRIMKNNAKGIWNK